jgi:hypothetical protein
VDEVIEFVMISGGSVIDILILGSKYFKVRSVYMSFRLV